MNRFKGKSVSDFLISDKHIVGRGLDVLLFLPGILLKYPVFLPLGVYVALLPFDNVLRIGHGGTLAQYLGIIVILIFAANRLIVANGCFLKPNRVVWGWFFYLLLAGVSSLWALAPVKTVSSCYTIGGMFLLYLLIGIYPFEDKDYLRLESLIVAGGGVAAIFVLVSYLRGVDWPLSSRASLILGPNRMTDPNHLATSLILPLLLSVGWIVNTHGLKRIVGILLAGMIIVVIFLTGSRGGLLGVVAALFVFVWRSRCKIRWRGVLSMLMVMIVSIFFIIKFVPLPHRFFLRFDVHRMLNRGGAYRTYIWRVGVEAFLHRPVLGYGYNNYPLVYDEFEETVPGHFEPHKPAHNIFLQSFVELGVVGGILLLFIVISHWILIKRLTVKDIRAVSLETAYVGIMGSSFFLGTLNYKYFWLVFILILILGSSIKNREIHEEKD